MELVNTQRSFNTLNIKHNFLGASISTGSYKSFIDRIMDLAQTRISSYICVMNVHMLMEARQDKNFARIVNNADMTTPDGMPLVLGMNSLYNSNQERVAGMDLISSLLNRAETEKTGVFFYGSTDDVLDTIRLKCYKDYPELIISGSYSPPFRALSAEEDKEVINHINRSNAGIVFVALGCPKQEKWMATMKGKINAVMIGLGGAFPVFAGTQSRAPKWMQRYSLEWLFRLSQEPGRLWKRYFVTNSLFLLLFAKEFVSIKFLKRP